MTRLLVPLTFLLAGCLLVRDFDDVTHGVPAGDGGAPLDGDVLDICRLETLWSMGTSDPTQGPYLRGVATSDATDTVYVVGGKFSSPTAQDESVGILLATPKANPTRVTTLLANLDQPVAVAMNPNGRPLIALQHGAAVLRLEDSGRSSSLLSGRGPLKDLTVDDGGGAWAVYGPGDTTEVGPIDLSISAKDADATRVAVSSGVVLVGRSGGARGLTMYRRSATALTRECELSTGVSVVAVATGGARMAWGADHTYVAPLGDCGKKQTLSNDRALGIAVDAQHVVARFESVIRVWNANGDLMCARDLPSPQPIRSAMANGTVAIDGKNSLAYVVSPTALYKLTWQ